MSAYKSLIIDERHNEIVTDIHITNIDLLPKNDILVKVSYSSLNYLDALIINHSKDYFNKFPHTPGIDAVGIVVESNSPDFCVDDEVLVTGFGLGIDVPGGFGEYIRVPADWATHVPTGLTKKDCMIIGSDGLAAALSVMDLMASGSCSENDNVVVSGASFGTGCIAVALLSLNNFNVTAVLRESENSEFAKILGAKEIVTCEKFTHNSSDSLLKDKYSIAVDTLGGNVLSTIMRSLKKNGSVAVCSAILDKNITIPINALTDRGINVLGINTVNCSMTLKQEAWRKLSGEWYLKMLPLFSTEISIMEVPEYSKRLLNGNIKGRIIINYDI